MKKLLMVSFLVLGLGVCFGDWFAIASKNFSYTTSVAITNNSVNPLAITALSCQFTGVSTGTLYVTKYSGTHAFMIVSNDFSGVTNVWLSRTYFDGDSIKRGEYYSISDDTGASVTNAIVVNLEVAR